VSEKDTSPKSIAGVGLLLAGAFLMMDKGGRESAMRVLGKAVKLMDAGVKQSECDLLKKRPDGCQCEEPEVVHTCLSCARMQNNP